jgi:transcriptional regulator with XRE-family HTH domain
VSGFFVFSGTALREIREGKNMSREILGTAVGKSASAIGLYELGYRAPDRAVLLRLASALGVDPRALVVDDPMFTAVAQ